MPKLKSETIVPAAAEDLEINAGIANDPDAVEVTDEMAARMRPAADVHPGIPRRVRGPQKAPRKQVTTIRLSPDVLEYFKSGGRGWQTRINQVLEEYVEKQRHA